MAHEATGLKLACTQAPVEREIYMNIPKGFSIDKGDTKDYVLKIHNRTYMAKSRQDESGTTT
jgi:hypothetical protein